MGGSDSSVNIVASENEAIEHEIVKWGHWIDEREDLDVTNVRECLESHNQPMDDEDLLLILEEKLRVLFYKKIIKNS